MAAQPLIISLPLFALRLPLFIASLMVCCKAIVKQPGRSALEWFSFFCDVPGDRAQRHKVAQSRATDVMLATPWIWGISTVQVCSKVDSGDIVYSNVLPFFNTKRSQKVLCTVEIYQNIVIRQFDSKVRGYVT